MKVAVASHRTVDRECMQFDGADRESLSVIDFCFRKSIYTRFCVDRSDASAFCDSCRTV
jgi:hypothetical protein